MDTLFIAADEIPAGAKFYTFTKKFNASKGAKLTAKVSANTRYNLYVNGEFVCDGPCKASQFERCYEEPDITPYLKEGENEIKADVIYLPFAMYIAAYKGTNACLWFDGELVENGKVTEINSDESWACVRDDGHKLIPAQNVHSSVHPNEEIDEAPHIVPVKIKVLPRQPHLETKGFDICGVGGEYMLSPRQIPLLKPADSKRFRVVKSGKGFIELDASVYTTAFVNLFFKGTKGGTMKSVYAECYCHEDGSKTLRDDESGILRGSFDIIHLNGKEQSFTTFWFRAFRYIRIEYDCEEFELDYEKSGYCPFFYPIEEKGTFECSRKDFNDMWTVSKNTVMCSTHELMVDCPYYEQQQYDLDSFLESLYFYRMTDDIQMQKKVLSNLAASQLPDGMLQANYPSVLLQVIPSFSLFWIMNLREYVRYTGDISFAKSLTGTMIKILEGFDNIIDENGLIHQKNYWPFVDWVPGWPAGVPVGGYDEPLAMLDLVYIAALDAGAEVFDAVGKKAFANDLRERAERSREAVNRCYWDEEEKMYHDTLTRRNFSEHTALWAVLSDTIKGQAALELIDRVMEKNVERCTFSMNYFVFRTLEKAGKYDYMKNVIKGWNIMLDNHCTTWCENPGACRSECHGWSSVPIYEFSEVILGVYPEKDGFETVRVKPAFDAYEGISYAKGTVPTVKGTISVSWEKKDGKTVLDVETPEGSDMQLHIVLPGKDEIYTNKHAYHVEF